MLLGVFGLMLFDKELMVCDGGVFVTSFENSTLDGVVCQPPAARATMVVVKRIEAANDCELGKVAAKARPKDVPLTARIP